MVHGGGYERVDRYGYDRRDYYYSNDRDYHYRNSLPSMELGVVFGRGGAQVEVRAWFAGSVIPRSAQVLKHRDGRPEVVVWVDNLDRVLQRWYDDNRDGRADRVAVYEGNRIVRVMK